MPCRCCADGSTRLQPARGLAQFTEGQQSVVLDPLVEFTTAHADATFQVRASLLGGHIVSSSDHDLLQTGLAGDAPWAVVVAMGTGTLTSASGLSSAGVQAWLRALAFRSRLLDTDTRMRSVFIEVLSSGSTWAAVSYKIAVIPVNGACVQRSVLLRACALRVATRCLPVLCLRLMTPTA
ncbi:hypothetical protein EON66_03935 [archaeon]|nr:MAG: hypothetical protein EON66_03935 [archaeon]